MIKNKNSYQIRHTTGHTDYALLRKLYSEGITLKEAARRSDMTPSRAARHLYREGIKFTALEDTLYLGTAERAAYYKAYQVSDETLIMQEYWARTNNTIHNNKTPLRSPRPSWQNNHAKGE